MYQFEEPKHLYLLVLIPIIILVFWVNFLWKKKKQKEFADSFLMQKLAPEYSVFKSILKTITLSFAFLFIIIALANPKIGTKMETVKREGIDIVFALDVSKSMLAEDVAPNRMEKAKQVISKIISSLEADRVGIIAYAGSAYPILPMTTDYSIAKMYLQNANTNMLSSQGTALDMAINQATNFFDNDKTSKLIILVSDGEDHGEGATTATEMAKEKGVKIVTIGIGTEKGGTIPIKENGTVVNKTDSAGETVITKLNPTTLQAIAKETKGKYLYENNTNVIVEKTKNILNNLEKTEFESQQIAEFQSQYQWFLALGFFFLLLDIFFLERKTAWIQKLNLFKEN